MVRKGVTRKLRAAGVTVPAGWADDPTRQHAYRFWDGDRWTDWVGDDSEPFLESVRSATLPTGKPRLTFGADGSQRRPRTSWLALRWAIAGFVCSGCAVALALVARADPDSDLVGRELVVSLVFVTVALTCGILALKATAETVREKGALDGGDVLCGFLGVVVLLPGTLTWLGLLVVTAQATHGT